MKIKVITHYDERDTEFVGDHIGGEVYVDGEMAFCFPDARHENETYIDGFIDGLQWYLEHYGDASNIDIEQVGVADGKQVW